MSEQNKERHFLDRFLSLFAPVHAGESGTVLLMALNVFLLMTAYYIIKPVREALILAEWGAETKIYASAGQAILLLAVVPLYSRLASHLPRRRLISIVLLFFAGCLVVFYILAQTGVSLGIPFYLWVGIFNMMVIAQFWAFANDIYTEGAGKRLFAILGFGQSVGAVAGSFITGQLIQPLGVFQLMLFSALLLIVGLGLTGLIEGRQKKFIASRPESNTAKKETKADDDGPISGPGGFTLVLRNKYLLLIAGMMILANLVNTTGEYVLGARVTANQEAQVPEIVQLQSMSDAEYELATQERETEVGKAIGGFYASFFSIVNLLGLFAQLFLVSRIVRWIGVGKAIMVLPLVALGGYALIALFPALAVARWAKTFENATDYSLQNTARNMLFLPTSREEKYKAKQAIDTFAVRFGDVMAAGLVLLGTTVVGLSTSGFALTNVVLALVWLTLTVFIGRHYNLLSTSNR